IPQRCERITPEMLPLIELEQEHIDRIAEAIPGGPANIQDIYPLVPLQEGILFHHLLNGQQGDTYVLPMLLSLSSRERLGDFILALQKVIDRHDILRTAVLWERLPRPVQVVYRHAILPVEELVLRADTDSLDQIKGYMAPELQKLDLGQALLLRLKIARAADGVHWYALLQIHHLLCDHESLELLLTEVISHLKGKVEALSPPLAYRTHVAESIAHALRQDAGAFFRGKLADIDEPTAPFGLLEVFGHGSQVEEITEILDPRLSRRLRAQARRLGVSAATIFHAAWALVLARTTGRDDVVFGDVLMGRLQGSAGARRIMGMFINTLPLRLRLRDLSVEELLEQSQRGIVELLDHEQASLAVAQRCSGIARSTPLFTALLNYRHSALDLEAELGAAAGLQFITTQGWTNYPVMFAVDERKDDFVLEMSVDRSIGPHRMMGYARTALISLISALERGAKVPAMALSVLPEDELVRVTSSFNDTGTKCSREALIHRLFEEQVVRTPDAIAVQYEGRQLSYEQLNGRANRLARYLLGQGAGPEQGIGICIGRGLEMVVGMLAILKAGGAYLPLDPNYPIERLLQMLEDAAPQVVLTETKLLGVLPSTPAKVIAVDEQLGQLGELSEQNLPASGLGLTPENLVYVIYTSGSTGRPKGTAMRHRSVVNLIEWHRGSLGSAEGKRVLQFAALSFDVAFQEIFSTLCTGGTLVLVDEWLRRDARELTQFLGKQSIERLFVPPLMLQSIAEYCRTAAEGVPAGLQDVITAGEQLRVTAEIRELFGRLEGCRLHNHYGPTETHVVTALTLEGEAKEWPDLPSIGRPIANTQI